MFTIALQVLLSLCVTATQTLLRYYIWGVDGGGWYLVTYDTCKWSHGQRCTLLHGGPRR